MKDHKHPKITIKVDRLLVTLVPETVSSVEVSLEMVDPVVFTVDSDDSVAFEFSVLFA